MRRIRKITKTVSIVAAVIAILLLAIYVNHIMQSKRESGLISPPGQIVEVDGHSMSVYSEGTADITLVFMSGGGTCSPILDFKSLYSLLSSDYQITVVEKFGYGFSEVVDRNRDIDSILEDTRAALKEAGLNAPFVLCPHSMSGLEALYWAQKYPDEVSAIIGLDMAVPQYYESMDINIPVTQIAGWAARIGMTRLIPGLAESDAIRYGTLTDEEKDIYRAVFYQRTATVTMINEMKAVRENAKAVESMEPPQLPVLLFISDGSGGTGFDKNTWRRIPVDYISRIEGGRYVFLDCPHYVHDHRYREIGDAIAEFLSGIAVNT